MSLLGSIGTNLALGAAQQLEQDQENNAFSANQLIRQRQAVIDKVSATQNAMDKQASDIADRQNSYMQMYNIGPDQAYALATNPAFYGEKDPDKQADFIKRMQPTGQTTTATGPTTIRAASPGQHIGSWDCMHGGYDLPAIPGVTRAGQPSRQIYSVGAEPFNAIKSYGVMPPPQDQNQAQAQMRVSNGSRDPMDIQAAYKTKGGMTPSEQANFRSTIVSRVITDVGSGHLKPEDAAGAISSMGGDPKWLSTIDLSKISATAKNDPIYEKKVNDLAQGIASQLGITVEEATPYARFVAAGGIKWNKDPDGQLYAVNTATNQPLDPTATKSLAMSMYQTAIKEGHIKPTDPPPAISPNPPQSAPEPQPQNPGASTPPQDQGMIMPKENRLKMDPQQYRATNQRMNEAPRMLANMNYVLALASKDPQAIGLTGEVVKHVGGPMENIVGLISQSGANTLDDYLKVGDKQQLNTAVEQLEAAMARPTVAQYMPTNSAGLSMGNRSMQEGYADMFSHADWHSTFKGFTQSLEAIRHTLYNNYSIDYLKTHDLTHLQGNRQAIMGVGQDLVNQGFSYQDAKMITRNLINLQTGEGLH